MMEFIPPNHPLQTAATPSKLPDFFGASPEFPFFSGLMTFSR